MIIKQGDKVHYKDKIWLAKQIVKDTVSLETIKKPPEYNMFGVPLENNSVTKKCVTKTKNLTPFHFIKDRFFLFVDSEGAYAIVKDEREIKSILNKNFGKRRYHYEIIQCISQGSRRIEPKIVG